MATRKRAAGKTPAQQAAGENPPARPPGKPAQSDPRKKPFTPEVLDRSAIAKPLQNKLEAEDEKLKNDPDARREIYPVIIDLHLEYPGGRKGARKRVGQLLEAIFKDASRLAATGQWQPGPVRRRQVRAVPVRQIRGAGHP